MDTEYEWIVCEGEPSWHQRRAGHGCAAITGGFDSETDAQAHADRLRAHHPDMSVRVSRRKRAPARKEG